MKFHNDAKFFIYFGDKETGFSALEYEIILQSYGKHLPQNYYNFCAAFSFNSCLFLRQVHGREGLIVDDNTPSGIRSFEYGGDFLITNQPGKALGILTADCLPIIIYDKKNHIISIIHAGWRGSLAGIAQQVVSLMIECFGSNPLHLSVFFGPSARGCCYQIDEKMTTSLKTFVQKERYLLFRNNRYYFDLIQFNCVQLEQLKIPFQSFYFDYSKCTICAHQFCSYRRQKKTAGRQLTAVVLK